MYGSLVNFADKWESWSVYFHLGFLILCAFYISIKGVAISSALVVFTPLGSYYYLGEAEMRLSITRQTISSRCKNADKLISRAGISTVKNPKDPLFNRYDLVGKSYRECGWRVDRNDEQAT